MADINEKWTNIVLTGFRATGKSTIGTLAAQRLGYTFLDTDVELARALNGSIADIVALHGWSYFRHAEAEFLCRLCSLSHHVIATGGGAIEHQLQWQMLRQTSFVAWLEADVATIQSRIASDPLSLSQRPALLPEKDSMETETMLLLRRRSPLYAAGSDIRLDATAKSPEELAAELCALYAKVLDGAANGKLQRGECAVRTEGEYEHDR